MSHCDPVNLMWIVENADHMHEVCPAQEASSWGQKRRNYKKKQRWKCGNNYHGHEGGKVPNKSKLVLRI